MIIVGQDEFDKNVVQFKNLNTGEQMFLDLNSVIERLKKEND